MKVWSKLFVLFLIAFTAIQTSAKTFDLSVIPRSIHQDHNKFIWLGTENDLLRYDGHTLLSMSDVLPDFIRQSYYSLRPTKTGIVMGGDHGIYLLNNNTISTILETNEPVLDALYHDGKLYFITVEHLYYYSAQTGVKSVMPLKSAGRELLSTGDHLYIRSFNHLCLLSEKCWDGRFSDIIFKDDEIILATLENLLFINDKTLSQQEVALSGVSALGASNHKNQIWAAYQNGVALFDLTTKQYAPLSLKREQVEVVRIVFQSEDGSIWLISDKIEQLTESAFEYHSSNQTHMFPYAAGLMQTSRGIYYGDVSGLMKLDADNNLLELIPDSPTYIFRLQSTEDRLWIGSYYGLFSLDLHNADKTNSDIKKWFSGPPILCIHEASPTSMVICQANQVYYLDKKTGEKTQAKPFEIIMQSHETIDVSLATQDSEKHYLGTGGGLYIVDEQSVKHYFPYTPVFRIHRAKYKNYVIVTTGTLGVKIFENHELLDFTTDSRSISGKCTHIEEKANFIWVTCADGMVRINMDDLTQQRFPQEITMAPFVITDTGYLGVNAGGEIITWTDNIQRRGYLPQILISDLFVAGKRQSLTDKINERQIEIHYSLSDFHEGNSFSVHINGKRYHTPATSQSANFTADYGKNIIEIVASNNVGTEVSKQLILFVEYPFYRQPMFYIAIGFAFLLACYALLAYRRHYKRNLRSGMQGFLSAYTHLRQDLSSKIYRDINLLKSNCLLDSDSKEIIQRMQNYLSDLPFYMSELSDNSLQTNITNWRNQKLVMIETINKDIQAENQQALIANDAAINKAKTRLLALVEDDSDAASKTIKELEITIQNGLIRRENLARLLQSPETYALDINITYDISHHYSANVESHLFCLVELLGNNAIDNGEATHIDIQLKEENRKLFITVVDNGIGYNVGQNGDENDLDGGSLFVVRSITQLLNGKLNIYSAGINQGTSITLILPIDILVQN